MKNALDKLDGTEINGRKIRLVEDRPRRRRYILLNVAFVYDFSSQVFSCSFFRIIYFSL